MYGGDVFGDALDAAGLDGVPLRDHVAALLAGRDGAVDDALRIALAVRRTEAAAALQRIRTAFGPRSNDESDAVGLLAAELDVVVNLPDGEPTDAAIAARLDGVAAAWARAGDEARAATVRDVAGALRAGGLAGVGLLRDLSRQGAYDARPAGTPGDPPASASLGMQDVQPARPAVAAGTLTTPPGAASLAPPASADLQPTRPPTGARRGVVFATVAAIVVLAAFGTIAMIRAQAAPPSDERPGKAGVSATTAAAVTGPAPSTTTTPSAPKPGVSLGAVPRTRTKVPSIADWRTAPKGEPGPHACYYKVFQDWLKLGCGHEANPRRVTDVRGMGSNGHDYFTFEQSDRIVDIIVHMVPGQVAQARLELGAGAVVVGYDWSAEKEAAPRLIWSESGSRPEN
jgi:hypothetical protein